MNVSSQSYRPGLEALPGFVFDGFTFDIVEFGGEPCLRADELGMALELEPPEASVLELYRRHSIEFAADMTARVAAETSSGPRQVRVFNLLGAYVVAMFADTPIALRFRRWALDMLMMAIQHLAEEIWTLRKEVEGLRGDVRGHEAQIEAQEGLPALAGLDRSFQSSLTPLVEAIAGLYERLEELAPAAKRPKSRPVEESQEPWQNEDEEESESPFDPARSVVASVGPFTVYAATLCGYDCWLINGRELWTCLESKQQFSTWMKDRIAWYGFQERVDYVLVRGDANRKDYFLRLGAALDLAWFDRSPRAGEVHDGLVAVARQARGNVIQGEAVRVGECSVLLAVPAFPDEGLVNVTMGEIGGKSRPVVDAKALHEFLGVGRDFSTWIKGRIKKYGFVENEDYVQVIDSSCSPDLGSRESNLISGANRIDYLLTTDMAKELAMVENNEQGRKVRRYFIKCERLVLTWHEQVIAHANAQNARLASVTLPDTPPDRPLAFQFHDSKKAIQIRVAVEDSRPWFLLKDLGAAMNMKWVEARGTFTSMPAELRRLLPAPTGERTEPALSEAGVWFFLGNWRGLPNAGLLRTWVIDDVFPALDARRTVPATVEPPPALPPLPPECYYTHRDPLQMTFVALADALLRAEGHPFHTAPVNHGRFLAWLWRNSPAGDWLNVNNKARFAATVGIDRRSLGRVLARVVGWDLVEQSPAPEAESPQAWPTRIRLRRDQVQASLRAVGLELPE
jgi:phage anti-repressor protein/prophage antirepressor-like protein